MTPRILWLLGVVTASYSSENKEATSTHHHQYRKDNEDDVTRGQCLRRRWCTNKGSTCCNGVHIIVPNRSSGKWQIHISNCWKSGITAYDNVGLTAISTINWITTALSNIQYASSKRIRSRFSQTSCAFERRIFVPSLTYTAACWVHTRTITILGIAPIKKSAAKKHVNCGIVQGLKNKNCGIEVLRNIRTVCFVRRITVYERVHERVGRGEDHGDAENDKNEGKVHDECRWGRRTGNLGTRRISRNVKGKNLRNTFWPKGRKVKGKFL